MQHSLGRQQRWRRQSSQTRPPAGARSSTATDRHAAPRPQVWVSILVTVIAIPCFTSLTEFLAIEVRWLRGMAGRHAPPHHLLRLAAALKDMCAHAHALPLALSCEGAGEAAGHCSQHAYSALRVRAASSLEFLTFPSGPGAAAGHSAGYAGGGLALLLDHAADGSLPGGWHFSLLF